MRNLLLISGIGGLLVACGNSTSVSNRADADATATDVATVVATSGEVAVDSIHVASEVALADGLPADCPASDQGNVTTGTDSQTSGSVTSFTYTGVGAAGTYAKVVDGWSSATGCVADPNGTLCTTEYQQPYATSGALAPFNEEMSMVFGGPVELYQIGVYTPASGGWEQVAYWDRCQTSGLAFTGNKSWYSCGGFVQSFVTADGTAMSATPTQFGGHVPAGTEVDVLSATPCTGTTANSDCGWSSGVANMHGFAGDGAGNKMFVVKFRMPLDTTTPAFWILPSQVLRSSQYGCNCRGMGCPAPYKGGCGELDVVEVTGGVATTLTASTSIYSFQNCFGGVGQWDRPVNETAIFVILFDASASEIAIRRLAATDFDFGATIDANTVTTWLAIAGGSRAMQ